jgi:hypothetical protein
MSIIPLLITEKWRSQATSLQTPERPSCFVITNFDAFDTNKEFVYYTKDEFVVYWLIKNDYCIAAPVFSANN